MKSLKNSLMLLLTGAVLMFSACDGIDEEPIVEPEIPGLLEGYDLHTLNPDLNDDRVLFKATLNTDDTRVTYGFMWYIAEPNTAHEVTTLPVGSGAHNGEFTLPLTDLPKNRNLVVCSYVRLDLTGVPEDQIGEEIDFNWDF